MKVRRIDFSPDEWIAGTVDLTLAERGMYITACSLVYSRGEAILPGLLRSFCHEDLRIYNRCLQHLLDLKKLILKDGRLSNKRCEQELAAAGQRSSTGSNLVRQRWNRQNRQERMKAARAIATHTQQEWTILLRICGANCLSCGGNGELARDHIIPVYQGGSDGIENIQPLCLSCNARKGPENVDYRPANWRETFSQIVASIAKNKDLASAPVDGATPTNHQPSTINHQKEESSPIGEPKKRGTRWLGNVSEEWVSEAATIRADSDLPTIDARLEAVKFADFWLGSGKTKLNWHATWRNWVRNARSTIGGKTDGRRTPAEGIYAGFAAALGDREADCRSDSAVVIPLLGGGRA